MRSDSASATQIVGMVMPLRLRELRAGRSWLLRLEYLPGSTPFYARRTCHVAAAGLLTPDEASIAAARRVRLLCANRQDTQSAGR